MKKLCVRSGLELPERFWDDMRRFVELVREHAEEASLISPGDLGRLWERHVADSLVPLILRDIRGDVLDFGSGAGFPGVVIAAARPEATVVLAETSRRKCAFLQRVLDELGLSNASVFCGRAEEVGYSFDFVALRATGPLKRTLDRSIRLCRRGGCVVLWAGRRFLRDLEYWRRFCGKRDATLEVKDYPPGWLPDYELAVVFVQRAG